MNATVEKALPFWGMAGATYSLIAARENAVYKIETPTSPFALRLHRKGYRSNEELASELNWMKAVTDGGLRVPTPIPSLSNDLLVMIDGVQVDVLAWLDGDTLDANLATADMQARTAMFHKLGQSMAHLHSVSDAWLPLSGFKRCSWNGDGLVGDEPLWDRFWDNPALTPDESDLFERFRQHAQTGLTTWERELDYGLIHADLVPGNVVVKADYLYFIDFDDGGYGFRIFEIATALLKHIDAPDYLKLKHALVEGYTSRRDINLNPLAFFMALRAATYVGWNIARIDEVGGTPRNARFIKTATKLITDYLG